jgi:hypothetical protein
MIDAARFTIAIAIIIHATSRRNEGDAALCGEP